MAEWEQIERLVLSELASLKADTKEILKHIDDLRVSFASHLAADKAEEKRLNYVSKEVNSINKRMALVEGNRKVTIAVISAVTAAVGAGIALIGGLLSG